MIKHSFLSRQYILYSRSIKKLFWIFGLFQLNLNIIGLVKRKQKKCIEYYLNLSITLFSLVEIHSRRSI